MQCSSMTSFSISTKADKWGRTDGSRSDGMEQNLHGFQQPTFPPHVLKIVLHIALFIFVKKPFYHVEWGSFAVQYIYRDGGSEKHIVFNNQNQHHFVLDTDKVDQVRLTWTG